MKYGMAEELIPATSEGGRAVEAFLKICPPVDRANLDREWMEKCGLFVKGWLAKAAEQSVQRTGLNVREKSKRLMARPAVNASRWAASPRKKVT